MVTVSPLVLLVDDEPNARKGYAELLERDGFRVVEAGNAEDALARSVEQQPDVVVTDISLPGEDGFLLAAHLRSIHPTRGIPIVAMTAHWGTDLQMRAQRAGIHAILAKPCQPRHLVAEVRRLLRL
jgi:CheY-like chemotaxis protein